MSNSQINPTEPTEKPKRTLKQVLLWLLAYKAVFYAVVMLCILLMPHMFLTNEYYANYHTGREPHSIVKYFETWDSAVYLALSRNGYIHLNLTAVFPLWPFCIHFMTYLTGGSALAAGLLLANIFSVAGFAALYFLLQDRFGRLIADRTLYLMLAFPGSLFYGFVYTESLYLLLSVLLVAALFNNRALKAGTMGFFAALTRPTGVFYVLPMAVSAFRKKRFGSYAVLLLPVLGMICEFYILYLYTGNAFAAVDAQKNYRSHASMSNLINIPKFIVELFMVTNIHDFSGSAVDRVVFLWYASTLLPLYRCDKMLFAYAIATGLVSAMGLEFVAFTRYVCVCFPMFLMSVLYFQKTNREDRYWMLVRWTCAVQIGFIIRQINFNWVG